MSHFPFSTSILRKLFPSVPLQIAFSSVVTLSFRAKSFLSRLMLMFQSCRSVIFHVCHMSCCEPPLLHGKTRISQDPEEYSSSPYEPEFLSSFRRTLIYSTQYGLPLDLGSRTITSLSRARPMTEFPECVFRRQSLTDRVANANWRARRRRGPRSLLYSRHEIPRHTVAMVPCGQRDFDERSPSAETPAPRELAAEARLLILAPQSEGGWLRPRTPPRSTVELDSCSRDPPIPGCG